MKFKVVFNWKGADYLTYVNVFYDAKDGFWINSEKEFTKGTDRIYYIMPHKIKYIEKIKEKIKGGSHLK